MGEFRDKVIEKTVRMFIGYERGCNYIIHVYIYITICVYPPTPADNKGERA